jgi:hypothetical protein
MTRLGPIRSQPGPIIVPSVAGSTIEDKGTPVTSRGTINFAGDGVTVEDSGGKIVVTIPGGAGASATTVEVDLGSTAKTSGKFTITDAAIASTSKVLCWQAPGPYTGKGTLADEAAMQPVSVVSVTPATGTAVVEWETPPMLTITTLVQEGQRRNVVGATFDRVINQILPLAFDTRRIGKVRGNVKFSYVVFS